MNLEMPTQDQVGSRQEYIEVVNSKYDSLKMLSSLVRHDIKNLQEELIYFHNIHKGDFPKEYAAQFDDLMVKIRESIALLSSSESIEFNLIKIIVPIIHNTGLIENVDLQCEPLKIRTDVRFYVSVLTNILKNAKEAYARRFCETQELKITIRTENETLIIEDNAGGFDVSEINYGVSQKVDEDENPEHFHGFFLKTMIDKCHLFNMTFKIERIKNGTRILVGINNRQGLSDDKSSNKRNSTD